MRRTPPRFIEAGFCVSRPEVDQAHESGHLRPLLCGGGSGLVVRLVFKTSWGSNELR